MLNITDAGLSAIRDARIGGFLLSVDSYALTEAVSSGDPSQASLSGPIVHEGKINTIEPIGISSIKLTIRLPEGLPAGGAVWTLRELGIYLTDGTLFAYGPLDPAYVKEAAFAVKILPIITANRLAEIINLTVSSVNSLACIPHVSTLPSALLAESNALLVLDQHDDQVSTTPSTSIAVKSGSAQNKYSFLGYNVIFRGTPDIVISQRVFLKEEEAFWVNDKEILICQVIGGPSTGECRKVVYDKVLSSYTVWDTPFTALSTDSRIELWRDASIALPERREDIPDYYCLGHAFKTSAPLDAVVTGSVYTPLKVSGVLASNVFVDASLTGIPKTSMFVYVDGHAISDLDYNLAGTQITVPGGGTNIEVVALKETPTTSTGDYLGKYEAASVGDGSTKRFFTSIIPADINWVMVFVGDEYINTSEYTLEATSVLLNDPPAAGLKVRIVCLANYAGDAIFTRVIRITVQATADTAVVAFAGMNVGSKQNLFVTVDGAYVQNSEFFISDATHLRLTNVAHAGQIIQITAFNIDDPVQGIIQHGIDTGPRWIDPAGTMAPPNRIVPKFVSYIGDGNTNIYNVPHVYDTNMLLVFFDGVWQPTIDFIYDANLDQIIFPENLPGSQEVDILALTEVRDPGQECRAVTVLLRPTNANPVAAFSLPAGVLPDSVCLFYNGAYLHRSGWGYDSNTHMISLYETLRSGKLELWGFTQTPRDGYRTEFAFDFASTFSMQMPLSRDPNYQANILAFVGGAYQLHTDFDYMPETGSQRAHISYAGVGAAPVAKIGTASLISRFPQTRLLLRSELENFYTRGEADTAFTLHPATVTTLGGVIVGDGLTVQANGLLAADVTVPVLEAALAALPTPEKPPLWCGAILSDGNALHIIHSTTGTTVQRMATGIWKVSVVNPDNYNLSVTATPSYNNLVNYTPTVAVETLSKTSFNLHLKNGSTYVDGPNVGVHFNVIGDTKVAPAPQPLLLITPDMVDMEGHPNGPWAYSTFVPPNGGGVNAANLAFYFTAIGGTPSVGTGTYTWSFTTSAYPEIISIDQTGRLFINGDRNSPITITVSVTDGTSTVNTTFNVNMNW
jgi:hypothetical protein